MEVNLAVFKITKQSHPSAATISYKQ